MRETSLPLVHERGSGRDPREFNRLPVVIPIRVVSIRVWEGAPFITLPGTLLNISRGGAGIRLRWVFPAGTRLLVSIPAGTPSLQPVAETVWSALASGHGHGLAVYGVRWMEKLSGRVLQSILLRQGLAAVWEAEGASGIF